MCLNEEILFIKKRKFFILCIFSIIFFGEYFYSEKKYLNFVIIIKLIFNIEYRSIYVRVYIYIYIESIYGLIYYLFLGREFKIDFGI